MSAAHGHLGADAAEDRVIPLACLGERTLDVMDPILSHDLLQHHLAEKLGRMALCELDNLLGDQGQVSHVSHAGLGLGLRLFAGELAIDDPIRDVGGLEKADAERRVVAPIHGPVEHLLDDVVHHIVEEVVPRILEKEAENRRDNTVLDKLQLQVVSDDGIRLVRLVGGGRWRIGHDDREVSSLLSRV